MSEPLITNEQLEALLSRAKGISKSNSDTMWEALVFVRGTYERERYKASQSGWKPVEVNDPNNDGPVWVDENGCVCWAGANGETQRLVLHGDMRLCLFVSSEEDFPIITAELQCSACGYQLDIELMHSYDYQIDRGGVQPGTPDGPAVYWNEGTIACPGCGVRLDYSESSD